MRMRNGGLRLYAGWSCTIVLARNKQLSPILSKIQGANGLRFWQFNVFKPSAMGIDCPDRTLSDLRCPKCSVTSMSGGGRAKRRRKAIRGDGGDDGAEGCEGKTVEEGDGAIKGISGRVGGVGECWGEQWRGCRRTPARKSAKG